MTRSTPGPTQRRSSRSTSTSRERERENIRTYSQDPGAVFETLADEDASDDETDEEGGTLRDSRTFVPPHVLARKESQAEPDVGWRSLAD